MERLRLWRSQLQAEKFNAAERALREAVTARSYWDIDADDDWLEILPPIEVAGIIMNAVESLLEVQLEWNYTAEGLDRLGYGTTGYWFTITDPETGFVLTHDSDKRSLSYYKYIESETDAEAAIIQLADIIAARLPVVRKICESYEWRVQMAQWEGGVQK